MAGEMNVAMLTADELIARLASGEVLCIVDVREAYERTAGVIKGAVLIPMQLLRTKVSELDTQVETVVVCDQGKRSLTVAQYLVSQGGFSNVSSLIGGMSGWTGELSPDP